jgi:hypothetical protein
MFWIISWNSDMSTLRSDWMLLILDQYTGTNIMHRDTDRMDTPVAT